MEGSRTTGTGNTVPAVQLALSGDFPLPISHQIPAISARPSRIRGTSACSFLAIGDRLAQLVGAPMAGGRTRRRPVVDGKIFNSRGVHVAIVLGLAIFDLKGKKLYDLKGVNITGELVGHLTDAQSTKRHLDKSTDMLFPEG
jgi:hypothetical protein